MASSDKKQRVPTTLRDFFFSDPFFATTWSDFDRLRGEMAKESTNFWKDMENEMKQVESSMSSKISRSSITSSSSSTNDRNDSTAVANVTGGGQDSFSPWFFPRRWMLPKIGSSDGAKDQDWKALDLFQHKDEEVIRIKDEDDKFELSLDMHAYRPDEIAVNVAGGVLSVEAKHEEKSEGRFESRQFSRSYTLPAGCRPEEVSSNLSSDGILVVSAPKRKAIGNNQSSSAIPVEHK